MAHVRRFYRYNKDKIHSNICAEIGWTFLRLFVMLYMTPFGLIYLFLIDTSIYDLGYFCTRLLYFVSCFKIPSNDYVFERLLGLNLMPMVGYRRLRGMSRLLFQSSIQIVVQPYLLLFDVESHTALPGKK